MSGVAALPGHVGNPGKLETVEGQLKFGFRLAVNRREKVDGAWVERVTWWTVTIWGKQAEWLSRRLVKGSGVTVIGEPYLDTWTKRDGSQG